MNLRPDQLEAHLRGELLPVYLVSGDEPLQHNEACDAIRAAARARGASEREVFDADRSFDWNQLAAAGASLSLFAEQRLLELRLPSSKPGDAGSKALAEYAANPPADTVLLISTGKLDKAQKSSKWVKALEGAGALIQVWPVEARSLVGWVERRMRQAGLQPEPAAAQLLADRVEGNLLAAAQEVDKLLLLRGPGPVDVEAVSEAVANSARFDLFGFIDTALGGDAERTARMLQGLREDGTEAILILWALARETRMLAQLAYAQEGGESLDAVFRAHRVWEKRKPLLRKALARHPAKRWQMLVRRAAQLDGIIKGAEPGNAWDELLQLALMITGIRLV